MPERTLVSVQPSSRSNFRYGFYSGLDQSERDVLGQTPIAGGLASGVLFGINSPKPARMKKLRDTGRSTASYVDTGSRSTAAQAGWKLVKRARARSSVGGTLSKAVYVRFSVGTGQTAVAIQYAWNMPVTLYNAIGSDRTTLGIKDISSTEDPFDLVFGARPQPPRAFKKAEGISTFVDPDTTLPDGWSMVQEE